LPDNSVAYIRDITMWEIVRQNNWERPIYYAVTVPNENIGMFVPYLRMEGLAYRLTEDVSEDGQPSIDTDAIWRNFNEVYDFESVLDEDRNIVTSIYRDAQTSHLLRNYPAALSRVGYFDALAGNLDRSIEALEYAYDFEPGFPVVNDLLPVVYLQVGRVEDALDAARRVVAAQAPPVRGATDFGESLLGVGQDEAAVRWAKDLVATAPGEVEYVQFLVRALIATDQIDSAETVIDDWVARSGDVGAQREFEIFLREREAIEDSLRSLGELGGEGQ
jgi:tetratricopeptide (TPR) repeat protein